MAYIRTKRVKGIDYLYLVEGRRVGAKVVQKVIKYLGPARGAQDLRIRYHTAEDIHALHEQVLEQYPGSKGVINRGYLDFIAASTMVRHEAAPTRRDRLIRKAAHLLFGMVSNHPFIDGNKRTGLAVAGVFLMRNGFKITCSTEEGYKLAVDITVSKVKSETEVADWLRTRIRRMEFKKGRA